MNGLLKNYGKIEGLKLATSPDMDNLIGVVYGVHMNHMFTLDFCTILNLLVDLTMKIKVLVKMSQVAHKEEF